MLLCPACGQPIVDDPRFAGRDILCPACRQLIHVEPPAPIPSHAPDLPSGGWNEPFERIRRAPHSTQPVGFGMRVFLGILVGGVVLFLVLIAHDAWTQYQAQRTIEKATEQFKTQMQEIRQAFPNPEP